MKALAALILASGPAWAWDSVPSNGPLSDDDFYRMVSCAAPPGQDCAVASVRWAAPRAADLTVAVAQVDPGYPTDRARALTKALYAAVTQINASGTALRLRTAPPGEPADITVHLLTIRSGGVIRGTGLDPLDGARIEAALVQLWWNDNLDLTRCAIVFPQDIAMHDLQSVALEELTQALGLRTDIDNPWYEPLSVFSENSNAVTRLGRQDIMALQRHYPSAK